jgi:Prokaryotic Cytochrome C oxidase subunit IV
MTATAQLTSLLRSRITIIWFALLLMTVFSWQIGADDVFSHHLTTILVLLVAFFKVRFVGLYFMELRDAPLPLKLIFEGYCVVVCLVLVTMYLAKG